MDTVENEFRTMIKRCCASCKNKEVQNDGTRWCPVEQRLVEQHDDCDQWTMTDGLEHAGIPRGEVKKKTYLTYLQLVRSEESTAIQMKVMTEEERKSIEAIRKEYEVKFKSIYLLH